MKHPTMTLDLALDNHRPPDRGDILTTARAAYLIVGIDPVDSRLWPNRWRVTLSRMPSGSNTDPPTPIGLQRVHTTDRYRRGETPGQFFGPAS